MVSNNVTIINDIKPIKDEGIHFRILCMTGHQKGTSFYLVSNRIILGRGNDADIPIYDTKASREHAELVLINNTYMLTDLKSQNGIMVNDLKVTQHSLNDNDKIIIGKTVFKFNRYKNIRLVKKDQDLFDEADPIDNKSIKTKNKPNNIKKILIFLVVFLFILIIIPNESQKVTTTATTKRQSRSVLDISDDISQMIKAKQAKESKEIRSKLNIILQRGQRELREYNYFRAIAEFNLALVLAPKNDEALRYLDMAQKALDKDIEDSFIRGKREVKALKYKGAIVSYCSVIRLLEKYQKDQRYKDAEENIGYIEQKLRLETGEIKCF